jgi:hypothetical protein
VKVKDLILKLQKLNQESEIYYLAEDKEGDEACYLPSILENQERYSNGVIKSYYTIEKHD